MKVRTGKFLLKESLRNLRRNRVMTLASVTSVIAALLVVGIFFVVVLNIDHAATTLESQVEMMVYLNDGLSENIITTMVGEIGKMNGIKSVTFVPKAEALKKLQQDWGDNSYLLDGLENDNPLPDTLVLKLTDPTLAPGVALSISSMSNIEKVFYGKEELEKLLKATYVVRMCSLFVIITLMFISVFIISNTIKLTVYARRKEIGIMKLVGATDWFVRAPFIAEGVMLGFLGALISTALLGVGYSYIFNIFTRQLIGFLSISLIPVGQLVSNLIILLLLMGGLIGAIGSMMSVRKFIKV